MHALDEVQPAFGVSEEELQQVVQNGIIHYSQRVNVSLHGVHSDATGYLERWQSLGGASSQVGPYPLGVRIVTR